VAHPQACLGTDKDDSMTARSNGHNKMVGLGGDDVMTSKNGEDIIRVELVETEWHPTAIPTI
jgi:hypothetical protein